MKHVKIFEKFEELGIERDELTIDFLNRLLSNYFLLYLKLWNFHWNVEGPKFGSVHKFFEELYEEFFKDIDETSERIRSIGGRPIGTMKGYLEKTELVEYDDNKEVLSELDMFKEILEDYEFIIREIRNFLSTEDLDNGTVNMLEDMIMKKEKDAWMIRSHTK